LHQQRPGRVPCRAGAEASQGPGQGRPEEEIDDEEDNDDEASLMSVVRGLEPGAKRMHRRGFMKSNVRAGATAAFARPADAAVAPGDRLTVGFLGCGARAHEHLDDVTSMSGVEVVAVADAYTGRAE